LHASGRIGSELTGEWFSANPAGGAAPSCGGELGNSPAMLWEGRHGRRYGKALQDLGGVRATAAVQGWLQEMSAQPKDEKETKERKKWQWKRYWLYKSRVILFRKKWQWK